MSQHKLIIEVIDRPAVCRFPEELRENTRGDIIKHLIDVYRDKPNIFALLIDSELSTLDRLNRLLIELDSDIRVSRFFKRPNVNYWIEFTAEEKEL